MSHQKKHRKKNRNNFKKSNQKTKQIFVGGCHPQIKNYELKNYFSQYGKIIETRLVKDKRTKKFRGFGFVTFANYKSVEDALKTKTHSIRGKKIEIKKAFTKEQTREKLLDEKQRKLYITGIAKYLNKRDMKNYFRRFGEVEDTRIIHDPSKNKEKGFGFVLFAEYQSLDRALDKGLYHSIKGCSLECKRTRLREEIKTEEQESQEHESNSGDDISENSSIRRRNRRIEFRKMDIRKISNHGKSGGFFEHEEDEDEEGEYVAEFKDGSIIPLNDDFYYGKKSSQKSQSQSSKNFDQKNRRNQRKKKNPGDLDNNDNRNNDKNSSEFLYAGSGKGKGRLAKQRSYQPRDNQQKNSKSSNMKKQSSFNMPHQGNYQQDFYNKPMSQISQHSNEEQMIRSRHHSKGSSHHSFQEGFSNEGYVDNSPRVQVQPPPQQSPNYMFPQNPQHQHPQNPQYQHPPIHQPHNQMPYQAQGGYYYPQNPGPHQLQPPYQNPNNYGNHQNYNQNPHPNAPPMGNFQGQSFNFSSPAFKNLNPRRGNYDHFMGKNPVNHPKSPHNNYNNNNMNPAYQHPNNNGFNNYQNYPQQRNNFPIPPNNQYLDPLAEKERHMFNQKQSKDAFRSNMFGVQPLSYTKTNSSDSGNHILNRKKKNPSQFKSLNPSPHPSSINSGPKTSNSSSGQQESPHRSVITPSIDYKEEKKLFHNLRHLPSYEEEEEEMRRRNMVLIHKDEDDADYGFAEESLNRIGIEVLDGGEKLTNSSGNDLETASYATPVGFQMKRVIPNNTMSEQFSQNGRKKKGDNSDKSIRSELILNFGHKAIEEEDEIDETGSTKAIIGNEDETRQIINDYEQYEEYDDKSYSRVSLNRNQLNLDKQVIFQKFNFFLESFK